jgi:hypothetical protein
MIKKCKKCLGKVRIVREGQVGPGHPMVKTKKEHRYCVSSVCHCGTRQTVARSKSRVVNKIRDEVG